jgi:hypothetical protein
MSVGRFNSNINQKEDIIMSREPLAEYGNKPPRLETEIPFDLKENQCVISYKNGEKTQYYKIENIVEKQPEHYPSVQPDKL